MNSNKPLVSIITPAFNCSNTIRETYISIKEQTLLFWEWIVTDDCSTDNTFSVLQEIACKDSRVIILQNVENCGTAISRNNSIRHARGRYIAFLDADDLWKPNKLEQQISFMQKENVSFSYSNYDVLLTNGIIKHFCPKKNCVTYRNLLKRNDIGCLTVVYDSKTLGKKYMPLDALKREDYAAWLDILRSGVIGYKINESLAIYRLGDDTLTSNKKKMIKYHYLVYRKHEKMGPFKSLYYLIVFSLNKRFHKYGRIK